MKKINTVCLITVLLMQLFTQNSGIETISRLIKLPVAKAGSAVAFPENTPPVQTNVSDALYFKTGSEGFPYTGAEENSSENNE